jgi:hypothetical protein
MTDMLCLYSSACYHDKDNRKLTDYCRLNQGEDGWHRVPEVYGGDGAG